MAIQPVPPNTPTVIPHLTVSDAKKAMEFYQAAFGATPGRVSATPDGMVMHAEFRIGSAVIYINDPFGPLTPPANITLHLWSEDVNALWDRAVAAGAKVTMPLADAFWGDRYGHLEDPFGYRWALAQHVEDVPPEELGKRAMEAFSNMGGAQS
jgi:PhnB protein